MKVKCELANRKSIRAFYVKEHLLIAAEGTLPTPGYSVDITQLPIRIWPPQYSVLQCPKPGIWPDVLSPYKYSELFSIGSQPDEITVHHAEGSDQVKVEDVLQGCEPLVVALGGDGAIDGDEATGFSKNLSFDEAFANALHSLPPIRDPHPDLLETISVVDSGALFGGIAGLREFWVRVRRTHD